MSDISAQLGERIRAATPAAPLRIRGGGTKDFYGNPPCGELLDVSGHRGILAYEPTELVITARCGTPLAEIEAALAAQGQCLPFEPPDFGPASTIGGVVAAGLSGARRMSAGSVRDYVLGVKLLDGSARELSFGGQVMKNVAGYDVSRLVAGSLGTLGVILEVSLKVLPRPAADETLRLPMGETDALALLSRWAAQPLPIAATCWHDGALFVRLAGPRAAVAAAKLKVGSGETASPVLWASLGRQCHDFFFGAIQEGKPLWRLAVAPRTPPLGLGPTLIEWNGAQRWLHGDHDPAELRAVAARAGGHATLFRADDATKAAVGAFAPLPPALLALHRQLKAAFDPRGILNPGRLYPDL
jgi:glycolate oxidase FAD binding subunit